MRRLIPILLVILMSCMFLSSCKKKTEKGYRKEDLTLVDETPGTFPIVARVKDGSDGENLTVEFTNNGEETWFYGEYYSIQVLIDGKRYYVPTVEPWVVHDLGHELQPGQTLTMTYSLAPYGTLKPGSYIIACGDIGNKTNVYYADFVVMENGGFLFPD